MNWTELHRIYRYAVEHPQEHESPRQAIRDYLDGKSAHASGLWLDRLMAILAARYQADEIAALNEQAENLTRKGK